MQYIHLCIILIIFLLFLFLSVFSVGNCLHFIILGFIWKKSWISEAESGGFWIIFKILVQGKAHHSQPALLIRFNGRNHMLQNCWRSDVSRAAGEQKKQITCLLSADQITHATRSWNLISFFSVCWPLIFTVWSSLSALQPRI